MNARRALAERVTNAVLDELRRRSNFEVDIVLHASLHGEDRGERLDLEDALFKNVEKILEAE